MEYELMEHCFSVTHEVLADMIRKNREEFNTRREYWRQVEENNLLDNFLRIIKDEEELWSVKDLPKWSPFGSLLYRNKVSPATL